MPALWAARLPPANDLFSSIPINFSSGRILSLAMTDQAAPLRPLIQSMNSGDSTANDFMWFLEFANQAQRSQILAENFVGVGFLGVLYTKQAFIDVLREWRMKRIDLVGSSHVREGDLLVSIYSADAEMICDGYHIRGLIRFMVVSAKGKIISVSLSDARMGKSWQQTRQRSANLAR